jgi:acetyl esterase/lipase
MSTRGLVYPRITGWLVAVFATTWLWADSAEKPSKPPLPAGVTVVRDLTYRVIEGRRLALDLYLPAEAEAGHGLRPALVALHGGSWVGGSRREYGPQFARCAGLGFVVAVVDYRLARPGSPSWDGALDDASHAVEWLTDHADVLGLDPGRLSAIGTSAGGLLAAHLARGDLAIRGRVLAAVCLSTPSDLVALATHRRLKHEPVRDLVGGDPEGFAARAEDASPMTHVAPGGPPMLLIHGTDDAWVSVNQARELRDKLEGSGVLTRLIEVEGARHGFELGVETPTMHDLPSEILEFLSEADRRRSRAR